MNGREQLDSMNEDRIADAMHRELEALTMTTAPEPSPDFGDRVMLAVGREPLPQPARAFRVALLGGHLRAAGAAVLDAARSVWQGGRPIAVRAQALALVLVVLAGSIAVVGGGAVAALGLANPVPPGPVLPSPSSLIPTAEPSATAEPSPSPSPSATIAPTETPGETAEPRETERAAPTATGTDDHGGSGGGSGSGSGGSGSGSGGSGGDDHTPTPTATDDHSGGDG